MQDKKLIIILKTFSSGEHKRFKSLVESPYFNKNENLVALLSFIQKYAPEFNHPKFTERNAFAFLFPKENYREDVITKLLHKLFELVKKFLVHQGSDEEHTPEQLSYHDLKEELALIDFYTKRFLKYTESSLERANRLFDELLLHDRRYYFQDFKLSVLRSAYLSSRRDKEDIGLKDALRKSEIHYYVSQLYLACLAVNQGQIVHLSTDWTLIGRLLDDVQRHDDYLTIPSLAVWYYCLLLLTKENKKEFYTRVKTYVQGHELKLGKGDLRIIYTFLENNTKKVTMNDMEFYNELFELYDTQLQRHIIESLQPGLFKNIIVVGLRLEKFDWIKQFLAQSQHNLVLEYRETVYRYIEAHLLFKEKKFDEVLGVLAGADYSIDFFFKLDARRMYLKVFYEMQYESAFYDLVNSFRKYLTDQKGVVSEYHIQANRDFIQLIIRLYQLVPRDDVAAQKLHTDINELGTQRLPEKDWLLQKLADFFEPKKKW